MRQISEDESAVRRYLLGDLPEAEKRRVEELFLLDPEYRENVLIIEDELIEDYLDGNLTEEERKKFLTHFLATPQQLRKLRIAKSLKNHAVVEIDSAPPSLDERASSQNNGHRKSGYWLNWRNPFVVLPMTAALLIVLILGAVKFIEVRRLSNQREQERSQRMTIERELAQLNDPARTREAQVFSVVLPPVLVRGTPVSDKISPPADATVVQLLLVLSGEKYPSYRVLLRRMDVPEPYTINNLHAETTAAGQAVALKLPTQLLTHGDYELQLLGVGANGEPEQVGNYNFQVTNRLTP